MKIVWETATGELDEIEIDAVKSEEVRDAIVDALYGQFNTFGEDGDRLVIEK